MNIAVVGTGYVGLVAGACLAKIGHQATCVDIDEEKIKKLKKGVIPIYEPGLTEVVKKEVAAKRLLFSTSLKDVLGKAKVVFIAVGTPMRRDGKADLQYVQAVAKEIGQNIKDYKVIVNKSTVPVGTGKNVTDIIAKYYKGDFDVVSNPEFLREGSAVEDFMKPDRIVIGTNSNKARDIMLEVYEPIDFKKITVTVESAEMIKYASNAFLATKISFINEIANICDVVGADVEDVARGMGLDNRIGPKFLKAGIGYGGSCLLGQEQVWLRDEKKNVKLWPIREAVKRIRLTPDVHYEALALNPRSSKVTFNKITRASRRIFNGNIYQIQTKMNKRVSVTSDHPFWVYEGEKLELKLARDLKLGDWLPVFTKMPEQKKITAVDLIQAVSQFGKFDNKKVRVRPIAKKFSQFPTVEKALRELFRQQKRYTRTRDVLRSNCLNLEEYLTLENKIKKWIKREDLYLFTSKGAATYCPAIINLDKNFCRLLGYYLSEGHINYEKGLRGTRTRIQFSFNRKEGEFIADVKNILAKNKIRYSLQWKEKVCAISVSSRILAYLLDDYLDCGHDSYTARLPEFVYGIDKARKLEILKGLFRGDGHIAFPSHTEAVVYDFGSISKELVLGMIQLFQSIGVVPSYKTSRSQKSTALAHFLRISARHQIQVLRDFKDKPTQRKINHQLRNYKKEIKPTGFRKINSHFAITKINKINHHRQKVNVYSLEVTSGKSFVTSFGLIVHNCFPKDVNALNQIAGTSGYDFKLLKAVIEVNNKQRLLVIDKLEDLLNNVKDQPICVLGLAFKANTDDIRESAAVDIIRTLAGLGAKVSAYDPEAAEQARNVTNGGVEFHDDPYEAVRGAKALVVATEWPEFSKLDYKKIAGLLKKPKILIDGRNLLDPEKMCKLGFEYIGVGRGRDETLMASYCD